MRESAPSLTAEAVCWMRATDQARPEGERILDDPYAVRFLSPIARALLAANGLASRIPDPFGLERTLPGITTYILARHRFIDDAIRTAAKAGLAQLVLLGAGYDARAYRLADALAGATVFELDHPATSRRKAALLARVAERPPLEVKRLEIDFAHESFAERLLGAGFRRDAATFFVWEGVSMYLTRAAVRGTLEAVRGLSGPGSHLAMDFWFLLDQPDALTTAHRLSPNFFHLFGEPITFGIHPEDVGPFLGRSGFRLADLADARTLAARYVRDRRLVYPANYVVHAVPEAR